MAETGDVLLFRTNNWGAKLQRSLTQSQFDHVAILVKINNDPCSVSVFDVQTSSGCHLSLLRYYILYNDLYTKIVYRKLMIPEEIQSKITNQLKLFIYVKQPFCFVKITKNSLGKAYSLTVEKLLRRNSKQMIENPEKSNYFCSELIADAFKQTGLLDKKISCSRYWPGDFSNEKKIQFLQGVKLGEQLLVVNDSDKVVVQQDQD